MAYANDQKTLALYDLDSGGTNLAGNPSWHLTPNGDGTFQRAATVEHLYWFQHSNNWTIEREVTIASAPGTILELAAWGETEAVNIQILVGWDEERRLYVGWERGAGMDFRLRAGVALPVGASLRVAVVRSGPTISLWANGRRLAQRRIEGPTGGGNVSHDVTPGLTLSVGRRVSTNDPQIYAGGGWLRVSMARTPEEIVADWRASYTPPVATGLTWEDLARRQPRRTYYVFRGAYQSGATVAWGTAAVHTPTGLVEDRLVAMPGPVIRGIPEKPGAMPERVSTSIVVDNADGAIDLAFSGGADEESAHEGDSILNLRGKLCLGFVGPDGVGVERAITPTLAVVGTPTIDGNRRLTLNLASDDEGTLGPIEQFVTVDQLRRAFLLENGRTVPIGRDSRIISGVALNTDWLDIAPHFTANLGVTVPWAYGISPIPLIHVGGRYFIACVVRHEPEISDAWELALAEWSRNARDVEDVRPTLWTAQVRATLDDASTVDVWVVGVTLGDATKEQLDGEWFLTPEPEAHFGMPSGVRATPAAILRQIVTDLSEDGAAAIDSATFDRTISEVPVVGACGGVLRSGASVGELAAHIVDPWGIALWMGTDDRLRAIRPTGWNADDAAGAAGELPRIDAADVVEGSLVVRQPASAEVGGASVRTSIDWTSEQTDFYLPQQLLRHAPGAARLALSGEPESRISGAWVHPLAAETALQSVGSRRAFVYTRIAAALPPWILAYELGQLFRLTHPLGPRPGGYERQLVRLIRMEHAPGEDAVMCEFLDCGALERLKPGKMDTAWNWIIYRPSTAIVLEFTAGTDTVLLDSPVADPSWTGASLWTFGASVPTLRRSWKITEVVSPLQIRVDVPAPASTIVEWDDFGGPHRDPWCVMRNRTHSPNHRPEYITLADEETGQHSDGTPGYRFSS